MKCASEIRLDRLYSSETYKKYIDIYNKEQYVDTKLLKELFDEYKEIYDLFLKVNIFLYYRNDIKNLRKDLQDYTKLNGTTLYIEDIDLIIGYYCNNYVRCRTVIKKIIQNKWVSKNEINILKKILNRDLNEEIKPIHKQFF